MYAQHRNLLLLGCIRVPWGLIMMQPARLLLLPPPPRYFQLLSVCQKWRWIDFELPQLRHFYSSQPQSLPYSADLTANFF